MKLKILTAPVLEPVTLAELKAHLRLDSQSLADDLDSVQSIPPGAHVAASAYSLVGTAIDVLGYTALVELESATNGASGTVDVKIQESDTTTSADFVDVTSGAFTQVTTANDNQTFEKAYTGTKQYIRVVATVGTATCDFGVSVIRKIATSAEDAILTNNIIAARQEAENKLNRALITQTWNYYLDRFPSGDFIEIPLPPLQTITHVKYALSDDTDYDETFSTSYYDVDIVSEPGRVVLGYGDSFPSDTLRPMHPIQIRFIAGYGTAASTVPEIIRQWILEAAAFLFEHRELGDLTNFNMGLLRSYRIPNI